MKQFKRLTYLNTYSQKKKSLNNIEPYIANINKMLKMLNQKPKVLEYTVTGIKDQS
jgi:hypothetical protein